MWLVDGLSPQIPKLETRAVSVGLMVDTVALWQVLTPLCGNEIEYIFVPYLGLCELTQEAPSQLLPLRSYSCFPPPPHCLFSLYSPPP